MNNRDKILKKLIGIILIDNESILNMWQPDNLDIFEDKEAVRFWNEITDMIEAGKIANPITISQKQSLLSDYKKEDLCLKLAKYAANAPVLNPLKVFDLSCKLHFDDMDLQKIKESFFEHIKQLNKEQYPHL